MKNDQKILLLIIIICIMGFIASTISFSYIEFDNNTTGPVTHTTTNEINSEISTEIISEKTTEKTTEKPTIEQITENSTITTKKNSTTTKINTTTTIKQNIGIIEEVEKKVYYYTFTEDKDRDYTGRNCLFLYDMEGNTVDGYANIVYYNKYRKKQFITKDTTDCFLEDKESVVIESIIVDGVTYE